MRFVLYYRLCLVKWGFENLLRPNSRIFLLLVLIHLRFYRMLNHGDGYGRIWVFGMLVDKSKCKSNFGRFYRWEQVS